MEWNRKKIDYDYDRYSESAYIYLIENEYINGNKIVSQFKIN